MEIFQFTHKTSSYIFWHGYLGMFIQKLYYKYYIEWELESRIRNLGCKYRYFGMSYWVCKQIINFTIKLIKSIMGFYIRIRS